MVEKYYFMGVKYAMTDTELDTGEKAGAWIVGILLGIFLGCIIGFIGGCILGNAGYIIGFIFGFLGGISMSIKKTKDEKREKMAQEAMIEMNKKIKK